MKNKGFFITGTDTGVGKTHVGAILTRMLHTRGLDVQPRKPVESGCRRSAQELIPTDGTAYYQAAAGRVPLALISRYRYEAPVAAERAARLAGESLKLEQVLTAVTTGLRPASVLLVEGAGGFYSPLCADGLNADLAAALGLPVVLVAADRLGCLNHILLTQAAIEQRGLRTAAIVLNRFELSPVAAMDNAEDLRRLLAHSNVPLLTVTAGAADSMPGTQLEPVIATLLIKETSGL
jgi:dethiobiotin synthetase